MKKIIMLLMALCLAMPAVHAELTSKQEKQNEKMAKNRAKDLKKKGYESMSSLPLESALLKHYNKMTDMGLQEVEGVSTRTKSKSNGRAMAQTDALRNYATAMSTDIAGKNRLLAEAGVPEVEREALSSAFLTETQTQIRGELQESYAIIKDNGDGTYEVQIMYLLNPEAATNAKARAIEKLIEEQGLQAELAKTVRETFKD
ncbi:MAG: hypothetical protein K2O24_04100 [Muribaculaceae bacterium]|nr:hypothetical protein [Muribaculaceae bacterium]